MDFKNRFKNKIFFENLTNFEELALELFYYQSENNLVYKLYQQYLGLNYKGIKNIRQIPFLPIEFFKKHKVVTRKFEPEIVFHSSGTSGSNISKHYISNLDLYYRSISVGFNLFFNDISDYVFIALLPSISKNKNSSLAFMVNELVKLSGHVQSGFYLGDEERLYSVLKSLVLDKKKIFIIGVSYALVDFARKYQLDLSSAVIMETGGMKGRKKELSRQELHKILSSSFNKTNIQSEYGMTELLSQAYSYSKGIFKPVEWMKIFIRDIRDPFELKDVGEAGGINIIDLANIDSCAFIETQDQGVLVNNKEFKVTGRLDNSDLRGCNLLLN